MGGAEAGWYYDRVEAARALTDRLKPAADNPFPAFEAEQRALVADLLAAIETQRLVTVVGIGGLGKTRVANEVARRTIATRSFGVLNESARTTSASYTPPPSDPQQAALLKVAQAFGIDAYVTDASYVANGTVAKTLLASPLVPAKKSWTPRSRTCPKRRSKW
mgnify:CR=1 FL=1